MERNVFPKHLLRLNALIAIGLGTYSLLTALYLWMSFHVHIPIRDTLRVMPLVQTALEQGFFSVSASDWFAAHAGAHRVTLIRAAMVIDHTWFGGQNHFIYMLAWFGRAALFLVFFFAFRQSYRGENTLLLFISGLSLAFMLSHTQTIIMIHPMGNTWYFALSASAVSIFLIVRNTRAPSWPGLLVTYLVALIAGLSNFSGIFIFLLLPVLIGLRDARKGLLSAVITSVLLFLYTTDMSTGSTVDSVLESNSLSEAGNHLSRLIAKVTYILSQVCLYLGSPLSIDYPRLATMLVVISFLVLGAGWTLLLRARHSLQHVNAWFETNLAMATLSLGVAIATCMGRALILEPTAERYQTVVMFYWLCICGTFLSLAFQANKPLSWCQPISTSACLAIFLVLTTIPTPSLQDAAKVAEKANAVSTLTVMGVKKNLDYRRLLIRGQPDALAKLDPHFRKYNSSYWLDVMWKLDMESPPNCTRVSIQITPSEWPDIFIVRGRIRDFGSKWYRQIPLFNSRGELIGYLFRDFTEKVTPARMITGAEDRWKGYIRLDEAFASEVYLHYRKSVFSGDVCRLLISGGGCGI